MRKFIKLKLFLLIAYQLTCGLSSAVYSSVNIDADDPNIQYVGKVNFSDPKNPTFNFSGVSITTVFQGTSLALRIQETPKTRSVQPSGTATTDYYSVSVDTLPAYKIAVSSYLTIYNVVSGLLDTSHTVVVTKRAEAYAGTCKFQGFVLDTGKSLLAPPARPSHKIEYFGDSFTCGYDNEDPHPGTTGADPYEYENSCVAFAPLVSKDLNADYHMNCWSGTGVICDASHTPQVLMYQTIAGSGVSDWNFNSWVPDIVVINIGFNDHVPIDNHVVTYQDFENAYSTMLSDLRSKYATSQIFCTWWYGINYGNYDNLVTHIQNVINQKIQAGDNKLYFSSLTFTGGDTTAQGHPTAACDRLIANNLEPIIQSLMGWTASASSPTAPGAVYDGTGSDISMTYSTCSLSANWPAGSDSDGFVAGYKYAIGTSSGASDIQAWTTLGNVASVTNSSLNLTTGVTYYFSVKTVDNTGLLSPATNSNGQYVAADNTAPTAPAYVRDGTGSVDISSTASTTQLSVNWGAATDSESGILRYEYAIGTTAGGTQTAGWTSAGLSSTTTRTGLSLLSGTTYYFSVRAVNGAGSTGPAANSDGQLVNVDITSPTAPGAVRDGLSYSSDATITYSTTSLSANWNAGADPESGISGYQYAIGTAAGGTQTAGWTVIGNVLTVTRNGLSLTMGNTYYFTVKSVNGSGLTSLAANSNGIAILFDSTPPIGPAVVRDGTGADSAYVISQVVLAANWDLATDPESGISSYQYAVSALFPGGTDYLGWADVGLSTSVIVTGFSLTYGTTYYFTVRALNGDGLPGVAANSNGQLCLDITPPDPPSTVRDGTGADIAITTSTSKLSANWNPAVDDESGISKYWYGIGTSPGLTNVVLWTNLQATSVTRTGLALDVGTTYYFTVKAENGVGMQSAKTNSNGVCVALSTADFAGLVISAVSAQNITKTGATIVWATNEQSTSQVEYGRTTNYGTLTIENTTLLSAHSVLLTGLVSNTFYHYRVISLDSSGNETDSVDYTFTTLPAGPANPEIHAYPNPCKISGANPVKFSIKGMTSGEVDIYTISGRLIKKQTGNTEISWDGKNTEGEKVQRGIYIYKITSASGDQITGKLVLTK